MLQNSKVNVAANQLLIRLRQSGVSLWAENGKLRYRAPQGALDDNELLALKNHKADILHLLATDAVAVKVTPDPASRFNPFPLSDVQSAYLLGRHEAFGYGGVACHIYLELNYPELDPVRVQKVWNQLILRHDMLRAAIDPSGYQQVREQVPGLTVAYTDVSAWDNVKVADKLAEIREEMGQRIYDTAGWPLFGIGVTKTPVGAVLHFSIELLIADWTSIWLLISEFEALYADPACRLPELTLSFRDYLLAERGVKETMAYSRAKDYWLQRLDELPPAPDLPLARPNSTGKAHFRRRYLQMDTSLWNGFKQQAQKRGVTPTAAVMAAYAAVIERWSRNKKFCLNLTVLNRMPLHPQVNDIVGDFTAVSLLAVDWYAGQSFCERARQMNKQLFADLDHRLFSGVEVLREIARKRGREAALMPLVFTSAIGLLEAAAMNQPQGKVEGQGISQTPQVFIDCQAMDGPFGLRVNWDIREGVFPDGMVDDMFAAFESLLFSLAGTEQAWDAAENVFLPAWQLCEREDSNATQTPLAAGLLHSEILEQAAAAPDRPAVIDGENRVTYEELLLRASAVAARLKELGCRNQDKVAIIMDKSVQQVAAVLGALAAGAVYVPIDTIQPDLRRMAILEKTAVRYVLTCSGTRLNLPEHIAVIKVDKLMPHPENILTAEGDPDTPAYIIHTSGSTGQPKGVVITHRAAVNTIKDINKRFAVSRDDRIIGLAQLGFDLSVYDIFGILAAGGTLVYPSADRQTDPSHWAELMAEHEVTIWNSVPALMQMLVSYLHSAPQINLEKFRLAMLSGDWIPLNLPDMLIKRVPSVQVVSLGGATEAAIWSIYHPYQGLQPNWNSIPYGRPLANQGFRVLDTTLRDCPVWVTGELYITGAGLAEGYYGDEKATREKFFPHPVDGQWLYRTGDTGRYTPGGEIEFLGREDTQVKIKGHRIELGEIEAVLQKHPAVAAAGVVVDGSNQDRALLGVVETAFRSGREIAKDQEQFAGLISGISEQAGFLTAELTKDVVEAAYAKLDRAILHSMLCALIRLGLFAGPEKYSVEDILKNEGIQPKYHWLVRRWLAKLTERGYLLEPAAGHFSCPQRPAAESVNQYWEEAETAWVKELGSPGFAAYLRSNAENLLELLSGRQDPVALLYPQGRLDYVEALYSGNIMVNYLNHCICTLLERIAASQPGKTLRILEVGAGTGATSAKVLSRMEGMNVEYLFTDVTASFIPRAKARFERIAGVRFGVFDVDKDYREQGLAPNSFDIVLAAGVLENARDIPFTMGSLKDLICPGGWLVFTEPTEEHAWILASQAFMMTQPADRLRLEHSYLNKNEWLQVLKESGDEPILSLPAAEHKLSALGLHLFAKRMKQDRVPLQAAELVDYIARQLPAHMLPTHLQVVDALPLTGNGKVDRRVLAKWRPKPITEVIAAQAGETAADDLELKLSRLWSEALGIPAIGRKQNFYEQGADSLIMAQVAGKIREILAGESPESDIPFDALLRQMLNYPTVAELAEFIQSQTGEKAEHAILASPELPDQVAGNAVLTSYGGGDTGPLRVVFHAALGTMNCFRLLLGHFDRQTIGPVLGITVKDAQKYCALAPDRLVETVADDYAGELLKTGHKKMQLVGYCLGGLFAVEVARRLLESGIQLTDMVLVDSHPVLFDVQDDLVIEALFVPNLHISLAQAGFGEATQDEFILGFKSIIERTGNYVPAGAACAIAGDNGLTKVGDIFRKMASFSKRERFTAYVNAMARFTGEQMPVDMAEGLFAAYRQSFLGSYFKPRPYMGDIRYLRATGSSGFMPGAHEMTLEFWREICLGDLTVTDIGGNHFSCVEEEPYATDLARLIALPLVK
ncbi:non-ribosomal peptide synthetase [Sporomusa sphaeroides]|uniref:Phenyloxazoline synthase MbtB n=1 Tax=Sporomusa sphaeroides DSM 2875 TaxID=1337886 RepID=A0ABM9W4R6_9FIRM|nr:non-ribosomal peptide synthetase [Sporomusa sphaeroides]OLS57256.1 phenyloxazoline synthase MbtB [Sporomusa sphaeroides DSM 2875]CVK20158.1 Phenyloxazoline synthase MbtB [Sporomusa sphaeroides DSM 2875]